VDVHRATDAVLAGLDAVARSCPNLTFVATTNHIAGVDTAFLSRADLVEEIGLPDAGAIERILRDTLEEVVGPERLNGVALGPLARDAAKARFDARRVRKLVLRAIASRRELALAPEKLRVEDLAAALRSEKA
jgi:AAA+ superfamily predicted ATPase